MTKNVYIVKRGDCLSIIAKKHGISLGRLLSFNPSFRINPHLIHIGQAIKISELSTITETLLISKMLFDGSYLLPKYQNMKNVGPIQEDNYTLYLKPSMPFDKSAAARNGLGWGEGGWMLTEHFWAKVGNLFGGRSGYFLHHDGGNIGTSGCIGLKNADDIRKLKSVLSRAEAAGQKSVLIEVKY